MKDWLKYTFLSFFSVKRANESRKRSFLSSFLCFILPVIAFFGCFYGGYVSSFSSYYQKSVDYQEFLTNAFVGENALSLTSDGKKFYSSLQGKEISELTVPVTEKKYNLHDYQLVIDTRDSKTNYNDFLLTYVRGEGENQTTISYEEYRKLDTPIQASYSMKLTYSDHSLELTKDKIDTYTSYLLSQKEDIVTQTKALMENDEVPSSNYNALYELYVSAYYPSFKEIEKNGNAPTMKTFYLDTFLNRDEKGNLKNDKYLIVLDDIVFTYFRDDRGNTHNISGYANGVSFSLDGTKTSLDEMILSLFKANQNISVFNFFVYALRMALILLIGWLAMGIIFSIIGTVMKDKFLRSYFRMINLSGLFFLFPGLLVALYSFVISFFLPTGVTYVTSIVFLLSTVFVRTLIQMILDYQEIKKKRVEQDGTENKEVTNHE